MALKSLHKLVVASALLGSTFILPMTASAQDGVASWGLVVGACLCWLPPSILDAGPGLHDLVFVAQPACPNGEPDFALSDELRRHWRRGLPLLPRCAA